jgi:enoyl-CoA hydratase
MYETLLYSVADSVATITLNRPDRLKFIVPPMPDEFEHAASNANGDGQVREIVLREAGRSFCAGDDLSGVSTIGTTC